MTVSLDGKRGMSEVENEGDENGIVQKDIELLMNQVRPPSRAVVDTLLRRGTPPAEVQCSRAKAVSALRLYKNDIVEARDWISLCSRVGGP